LSRRRRRGGEGQHLHGAIGDGERIGRVNGPPTVNAVDGELRGRSPQRWRRARGLLDIGILPLDAGRLLLVLGACHEAKARRQTQLAARGCSGEWPKGRYKYVARRGWRENASRDWAFSSPQTVRRMRTADSPWLLRHDSLTEYTDSRKGHAPGTSAVHDAAHVANAGSGSKEAGIQC
jgi:hypothetical protein